jgi:hypothetical protein
VEDKSVFFCSDKDIHLAVSIYENMVQPTPAIYSYAFAECLFEFSRKGKISSKLPFL